MGRKKDCQVVLSRSRREKLLMLCHLQCLLLWHGWRFFLLLIFITFLHFPSHFSTSFNETSSVKWVKLKKSSKPPWLLERQASQVELRKFSSSFFLFYFLWYAQQNKKEKIWPTKFVIYLMPPPSSFLEWKALLSIFMYNNRRN